MVEEELQVMILEEVEVLVEVLDRIVEMVEKDINLAEVAVQ